MSKSLNGGFIYDVPLPRISNNSKAHERIPYLKVSFFPEEMRTVEQIQKNVSTIFNANDISFNVNEMYRIFTLNMDNKELLEIMFNLYKKQGISCLVGSEMVS